ncbi:MAG: glycosyl hydrolase 53 family protein [Selenomonadaceae bacterium]|nr:glycosyl hydrolase 53 family protein [Selenomonadaceae bacterium]
MKKGKLTRCILGALLAGALTFTAAPGEAAVQVNPIPGISANFIKGADLSMVPTLEANGAQFKDVDGTPKDVLQIFKEHGVNWVRFRIWNDPKMGGGDTDEAKALAMTKRAKALGLKVLIDFHYSDFWADPAKQAKPQAWEDHDKDQLVKDVYDYTAKVLKDFQAQGTQPDMIQVGNEIMNGMMWPEGKFPGNDNGKELARLVQAGLQAIHDNDPKHEIRTMIHLADGGNNWIYQNFFNALINDNKVNDFDVIGLSYYPFWHGTLDDLSNNINDISKRYNKDVIVVETAFGYTNENFDKMPNAYGAAEECIGGFRSTPQGQASGLRAVMERVAKVPNNRGLGMFYWAPDWYAVPNVGWKTGEGNEWDNLAMFDNNGRALESMDVWNDVSNPNGKTVTPTFKEVEVPTVIGNIGVPVQLPKKVLVTYSDDHTQEMDVNWEKAPTYSKLGTYKVKGTIAALKQPVTAQVKVIKKVNLFKNPGFEDVTLNGWTVEGDTAAVNAISKAGDSLGKGSLHYWADHAFKIKVSQSFKNLKPGKYTVRVSTQGGGGQSSYKLFVQGDNGKMQTTDIKDTAWNKWNTVEIKDVEIKGGTATAGVMMDGAAGNWGTMDNFEFFQQE